MAHGAWLVLCWRCVAPLYRSLLGFLCGAQPVGRWFCRCWWAGHADCACLTFWSVFGAVSAYRLTFISSIVSITILRNIRCSFSASVIWLARQPT